MANEALDATKYGDPPDCRGVGEGWLKGEVHGIFDDGYTDVNDVHGKSMTAWEGRAGEAFRVPVNVARNDLRGVADQVTKIGKALSAFADALEQDVHPKLDEALEIAGGVLTVTRDGENVIIEPPGAVNAPASFAPVGATTQTDTWSVTQHKAYSRARGRISAARHAEEKAHRELREALGKAEEGLLKYKAYFDNALVKKNQLKGGAVTLLQAAEEMRATSGILEKLRMGEKLSPAELRTAAMWLRLDKALGAHATAALGRRAQTVSELAGEITLKADAAGLTKAQSFLNAKVGDVVKKMDNTTLVVFGADVKTMRKLQGVPLIGTGYKIINAGIDLGMRGKSVSEVLAKTTVDYGKEGAVAVATRWGSKAIRFGGLVGAVGTTVVFDGLKLDKKVDDAFLDKEFGDLIVFDDKER